MQPEPPRSSVQPASSPLGAAALDDAVDRGRRALVAAQRPDGSWESPTDLGPIGPAMQWIVERLFDALPPDDAAEGARFLLAQQRPDGSFLPYPGAPAGTAAATALCRAGLLACGLREDHAAVGHALGFVDAHGGHAAVTAGLAARGDATGLFLLVMGVVDADFLPPVPPSSR